MRETKAVITANNVVKNDFMNTGVLLLGTNLGDKSLNITKAKEGLGHFCNVLAESSWYESDAWGFESADSFINVALKVEFSATPEDLLEQCLQLEIKLGRTRSRSGYTDRTMDIDILTVDGVVQHTPVLTLPHPRIKERLFALLPLKEVCPEYVDVDSGQTIDQLISVCEDTVSPVRLLRN